MDYLEKLDKIYDIKEDFKNVFPLFGIAEPGDRFSDYPDLIRQRKNPYDLFFEEVPGEYVEEYKKIDDKWYKVFKKKFKYVYADDVFVEGDVVGMEETERQVNYMLSGKFTDNSTNSNYWYKKNNTTTVNISSYVDPVTKEFSVPIPESTTYLTFYYNDYIEKIYSVPDHITKLTDFCRHCTNLTYVKLDTAASVTDLSNCVRDSSKLVTFDWGEYIDVSECTGFESIFNGCTKLRYIYNMDKLKTSSVTHAEGTFMYCVNLVEIDISGFRTENCNNFYGFLDGCSSLTTLHLSDSFDMKLITNELWAYRMFPCIKLANVTGVVKNYSELVDLTYCPLTNESAMVFINGLAPVTSSKRIRFKSTTYNTLTAEQKAIATSKGWSVTT